MTYNKDWVNVNSQRAYPFIENTILNSTVLDISIAVPVTRVLPLKVSKVFIGPNFISLRIVDQNEAYVGVFTYRGSEHSELSAASANCNGSIIWNTNTNIFEDFPITRLVNLELTLELHTSKLIPTSNISTFNVERGTTTDSVPVTGGILLAETPFSNLELSGNDVVISSKLAFGSTCVQQIPVQSIMGVTPNETGTILLESQHAGMTAEVIDVNKIEIGSEFTLPDFDKRSLTGSRGRPGNPGTPGDPGVDGQIICDASCDTPELTRFTGLFYDSLTFTAIFSRFISFESMKHVKAFNEDIIFTIKGDEGLGFLSTSHQGEFPNEAEWALFNTGTSQTLNDLAFVNNDCIVVGNNGYIQKFSLFGFFLEAIIPPVAFADVLSIDQDGGSDFMIHTADNKAYLFDGSFSEFSLVGPGTITRVVYDDGVQYVLYDNGTADIFESMVFKAKINVGSPIPLRGLFGEWVVGDGGLLRQINPDFTLVSGNHTTETTSLLAIEGFGPNFVVAVGDVGTVLRYNGISWVKLDNNPTKRWTSVSVVDTTNVYIFGEQI